MKIIGILIFLGIIVFGLNFYSKKELKSMKSNNKSFEKRLDEVLILTEKKYKKSDGNFGINFSDGQMVIFQIIKRTLIENPESDDFGYGIHLSFDDTFPETKGELERFKNSDFADKFQASVWDGILTYQLDLKEDKKRMTELTQKIIELVYQKNIIQIEIDEFEI